MKHNKLIVLASVLISGVTFFTLDYVFNAGVSTVSKEVKTEAIEPPLTYRIATDDESCYWVAQITPESCYLFTELSQLPTAFSVTLLPKHALSAAECEGLAKFSHRATERAILAKQIDHEPIQNWFCVVSK